jgi:hypothetical protein
MGEECTIVTVATDDMAVTSKRISDVMMFKSELQKHFSMTDLGKMSHFLGFEVGCNRAAQTIAMNQGAYIETLAEKIRLPDAKAVTMSMGPGALFWKAQGPSTLAQTVRIKNVPYSEAIGSISYGL